MLTAIWGYRHFILASIKGELKGRYARSKLGVAWSILHPLAQAALFAVVLAGVLGTRLPGVDDHSAYPIYLLSGMAAWALFSEILGRCINIFIEYSSTLKKISFPRICLPLIVWGSALLSHIFLLMAIMVIFLLLGHAPGLAWLSLPIGIFLISLFAFGIGLTLGVLNVFARDISQAMVVILQLWFWMTPVVYPIGALSEHIRGFVQLNPMVAMVKIYQDAILLDRWPDMTSLVIPAFLALAVAAMAFSLFRRASPELVDAL